MNIIVLANGSMSSNIATEGQIRKEFIILTPGRYIDFKEAEKDGQPFDEKMTHLTATLKEQITKAGEIDSKVKESQKKVGYEI